MQCLLCNRHFTWEPTIGQWLRLGTIQEPVICPQCKQRFHHYPPPHCRGCGRHIEEGAKYCAECRQWQRHLGWTLAHRCLYPYDEAMKELMQRYKFQGDYFLRFIFQPELTRQATKMKADLIVPIPVTSQTMQHRGFNQVEGMLTCPLAHFLQTISREKQAQSTKSRKERLATPQPFKLSVPKERINGKRILIVDDVYTTGRTIYHAAALLRAAGAQEIMGLSLAG